MIKLKAALSSIGVINAATTDASGGINGTDFSENEQHLLGIIRSLQDEVLCNQRELAECYQVIEECKMQLEGVRSLILLATADELDMEALRSAHGAFAAHYCRGGGGGGGDGAEAGPILSPRQARHGDAPVGDGGAEHVVEREPAD